MQGLESVPVLAFAKHHFDFFCALTSKFDPAKRRQNSNWGLSLNIMRLFLNCFGSSIILNQIFVNFHFVFWQDTNTLAIGAFSFDLEEVQIVLSMQQLFDFLITIFRLFGAEQKTPFCAIKSGKNYPFPPFFILFPTGEHHLHDSRSYIARQQLDYILA